VKKLPYLPLPILAVKATKISPMAAKYKIFESSAIIVAIPSVPRNSANVENFVTMASHIGIIPDRL
jgi:hypothetical protein